MITANIPLAQWNTHAFIRVWPQYRYLLDELLSSAFIGLVNGVDGLKRRAKGRTNPSAYITRAIKRQLSSTVREEIHKGYRDKIRPEDIMPRRKGGIPEEQENWVPIDALWHPIFKRFITHESQIDTQDALDAACNTDLDRQIIRLRIARYTLREIGSFLKIHWTVLGKWLKRICIKFDAIVAA
jgi:hypothetical protein